MQAKTAISARSWEHTTLDARITRIEQLRGITQYRLALDAKIPGGSGALSRLRHAPRPSAHSLLLIADAVVLDEPPDSSRPVLYWIDRMRLREIELRSQALPTG